MNVRVKKWREDAQPEWPEVASTQVSSATEGRTQAFPETGGTGIPVGGGNGIPVQSDRSAAARGRTERLGTGLGGIPGAARNDRTGRPGIDAPAGEPGGHPEAVARTAVVRDPWAESAALGSGQDVGDAAPTHDPHEVTVQLDGMSRQLEELLVRQAKDGVVADGAQDGSDGPVFVDESGRRSRRFRRIGITVGLACGVYAVVIVATLLSGNSNAPWLPVPGQQEGQPAGKVDTPPLPADSALPSGTGGIVPGSTPTAGSGTATAPAPGATAPGATTGPGKSGAPAAPKPTATGTATRPGPGTGSTAGTPTPTPTPTVTDPVVTPTPTDPGPTITPTETTTGNPAGPGTVADGPSTPTPVASESTSTDPAAPAPAPAPSAAPIT